MENDSKTKNASLLRKSRNADVLKRMKEGESLNSFDSNSSWFPPRPMVEKDPDAVKKLYGKGTKVLSSQKDEGKSKKLKNSDEVTQLSEAKSKLNPDSDPNPSQDAS